MIKELNVKINKFKFSVISFLFTFICGYVLFVIKDVISGHKYMFFSYDLQNQMLPVLNMFYRHIISFDSVMYSFDIGLGSDSIPLYTNGSCFSLINVLLLFPISLNIKLLLIYLIKMSLSAFFFCLMVEYVAKKKNYLIVLFSISYALSSFNIVYYHVIIWQDGMYLLPIIILCIYKYVNEKKTSVLIIAYAYLFVCNFYSGYVIGIYSFVFFILLLIFDKRLYKEKIELVFKYLASVFVSVMVSSALLLPTAIAIVDNDNSENTQFSSVLINIFDLIKQFYIGQFLADEGKGNVPYVYCGLLPLMCIIIFFISSNIQKKKKIVFGSLLLLLSFCLLTKPGYMFMHAFNNPDNLGNRFAFLVSFTLLMACSIECDSLFELKKKRIIGISSFLSIYIVAYSFLFINISKVEYKNNLFIVLVNIVFLLVYMFALLYLKNNNRSFFVVITIFMVSEIVVNGLILNNTLYRSETEYKEVFNSRFNTTKTEIDKLENDYTRVVVENPITHNLPQWIGYRSVNLFSSFADTNTRRFMRHIGFLSDDLGVDARGYTDVSGLLLGVNYVLGSKLENNLPVITTVEEKKALPLCYMSNDSITSVQLSENPFDNINQILSSLSGKEIKYFYNTGNNIEVYYNNIIDKIGDYNEREVIIFGLDDSTKMYGDIHFVDESGESKYCYIGIKENYEYYDSPIIWGNNVDYRETNFPSFLSSAHIVDLNEVDGMTECYIIIDEESMSGYYYDMAYFYGTNDFVLDDVYDSLLDGAMKIDSFEDGYISGKVNAYDSNQVLFTSIPYDDNWNIYVDGIEIDKISLLDDALLGAVIPEGEHYVELKYKDKWFSRGMYITIIGALMWGCFVIFENKRDKKSLIDKTERE